MVWLAVILIVIILIIMTMPMWYIPPQYKPITNEEEIKMLKSYGLSDEEIEELMDDSWKRGL